MSKFNQSTPARRTSSGPIRATSTTPNTTTHEGGPGYTRDAKSDLFILAVSNFVATDTFYEKAAKRDQRYADLCHAAAVADPQWYIGFVQWLRCTANMRSASIVAAAEGAHALTGAKVPGYTRPLVRAAMNRADEPGEFLAYWRGVLGHHSIPGGVQRGLADAVNDLYTEFSFGKYDSSRSGYRFGDVIELVHPVPNAGVPKHDIWGSYHTSALKQSALFKHAINVRHGHADEIPEVLGMLRARQNVLSELARDPNATLVDLATGDLLSKAGLTWENVLSAAGDKIPKAKLWTAMIPHMGYMALLRNLRNFDQAGIPDALVGSVVARLVDPAQVARSRQFPYRFWSAHKALESLRWSMALETALNLSLTNLPDLSGTLVLVDTSASMGSGMFAEKSKMTPVEAGALFGVALAIKGDADLYGFADGQFRHRVPKGSSVLELTRRFVARVGEVGHGTQIADAVRGTYDPTRHNRIVIVSDMQTFGGYRSDVSTAVPANVPIYAFNLGGYAPAAISAGTPYRYELGGLTDATFTMISNIERGEQGTWPWVTG